jgi:hypothetical protein
VRRLGQGEKVLRRRGGRRGNVCVCVRGGGGDKPEAEAVAGEIHAQGVTVCLV